MAGPADFDLAFAEGVTLSDSAAAALEDYARVLTRAAGAFVLRDEGSEPLPGSEIVKVRGLRLRAAASLPIADTVAADVFAFARDLADGRRGGLGWS
jgi:hypothetical protein